MGQRVELLCLTRIGTNVNSSGTRVHPKGRPLGVQGIKTDTRGSRFQRSVHSIVGQRLREIQQ